MTAAVRLIQPPADELRPDARAETRQRIRLDAEVSEAQAEQLTGTVHDLSAGGFMIAMDQQLAARAEIEIRLAAIGSRRARVIWREEGIYGCSFHHPLSPAELHQALSQNRVIFIEFRRNAVWHPVPEPALAPEARGHRAMLVAAAAALAWGAVATLVTGFAALL